MEAILKATVKAAAKTSKTDPLYRERHALIGRLVSTAFFGE
jgi:hypothetical protein